MLGTILLMDNMTEILDKWGSLLEQDGYRVIKAATIEEAEEALRNKWIQLAILDIRMRNEDDENDISGLLVAQNEEFVSIPKIILTAYPSFEYVRGVLVPDVNKQTPALNFIYKPEGPNALRAAIKLAFEFTHTNQNLKIQWDTREHLSFLQLSSLIDPDLSNEIHVQRADELEDLTRRLFHDYRQVQFGRLFWHERQRFCLPVLVQSPDEVTDLRILVCGKRDSLELERANKDRLAPGASHGTESRGYAETTHFGANAYCLQDAQIGTVQTVRDLFQIGKERPLKMAFTHLLGDLLKTWHQHGQKQDPNDLMSLYRQWVGLSEDKATASEVGQRVDSLVQSMRTLGTLEIKRDRQEITFRLPNDSSRSFPDPVAAVYNPLAQFVGPVVCRVSPGRLTADNILVDAKLRTWLTDFSLANQAPQWWDFVCLEAAIRFDLSQAPDLVAWQDFEECLMKSGRLDAGLDQDEVIPELRAYVALIEQVRRQAASESGPDLVPYHAGLLAWAVEAMTHYDPGVLYTQADRLRGAHLLLAAGMIAERLGIVIENSLPTGRLRLDENGKVWIGEKRIAALTGLRLKLLRCLLDHEGQPVSNRAILEKAYEEPLTAEDLGGDKRIRQEIHRLREEIEPDPKRPRYILTERDIGYRLQASGEPEE